MKYNYITWERSNNSEQKKQTKKISHGNHPSHRHAIFSLLFALCSLLFVPCSLLFAETPSSFSGDIRTGVLWGTSNELLYRGDGLLSQLDWRENNVPFVGLDGTFAFGNFLIHTGALFAIPSDSGIVEDRDWQTDNPSVLASYSEHDAHLDSHIDISAELAYRHIFQAWRFSGGAGLLFRSRTWSATGGYLQHPDDNIWTPDAEKKPVYGIAITYEQTQWLPFIFIESGFTIKQRFEISLRGGIYPLMYVETVDTHNTTGWEFTDKMSGGLGGTATLTIIYKPTRTLAFKLSGSYENIVTNKGQTFSRPTNQASKVLTRSTVLSPQMKSSLWSVFIGISFT
jgi:outer membrane protease